MLDSNSFTLSMSARSSASQRDRTVREAQAREAQPQETDRPYT